jgi:hypothetical protein
VSKRALRISLLHATYRRHGGPLEVKQAWSDAAVDPGLVEHVFAMDDDDVVAILATTNELRVVSPRGGGVVTAVRNWNAAAAAATGDLLLVVADDLFPPPGWDLALRDLLRDLDPTRLAFAVKLTDSTLPDDRRLRHPVVSRAFYDQLGLFSREFSGLHCDDDITLRAFWKAMIVDGREIQLEHRHPTLSSTVDETESQRLLNSADEWERGRDALKDLWPFWRRQIPVFLVRPASTHSLTENRARCLSSLLRLRNLACLLGKRIKTAAVLARHPLRLTSRVRRLVSK